MKKNKKLNLPIESFTLDLTDAILPKSWPLDIPLILKLQTGQYEKNYDIAVSDEPWYQSLLKFVAKNSYISKNESLPIGISATRMQIGAKIYNSEQVLVAQGKDKQLHLSEVAKESYELEQVLIRLRANFPGIKDKYLIDFNETQQSLLKDGHHLTHLNTVFNTFNDVFMSGGGSTYSDGSSACLGAYSSVIDYEVLNCTINLFNKEELILLEEAAKDLSYLSPIYSLIYGQVKRKNEKSTKLKIK